MVMLIHSVNIYIFSMYNILCLYILSCCLCLLLSVSLSLAFSLCVYPIKLSELISIYIQIMIMFLLSGTCQESC